MQQAEGNPVHFDRLYHGSIAPATPRSRHWQWVLRDLERLARCALVFLLALAAVQIVGKIAGYLWWCVEQWGR